MNLKGGVIGFMRIPEIQFPTNEPEIYQPSRPEILPPRDPEPQRAEPSPRESEPNRKE